MALEDKAVLVKNYETITDIMGQQVQALKDENAHLREKIKKLEQTGNILLSTFKVLSY